MRISIPFLLILSLAAPSARAGDAELLKPRPTSDETYTESFVVVADLEDGSYLKAQLGVSNAGPGDQKGGCRLYLAEPGHAPFAKSAMTDEGDWTWAAKPAPSLSIGSACRMTAGEKFTLKAEIEGASMELTVEASASTLRQRVHEAKSSSGFYELEVLIPWGRAKASFARPGEKPRIVAGSGYVDHSRANALPAKTARQWVRFRALSSSATNLYLVRFPPGEAAPVGWRWVQPAAAPTALSRVAVSSTRDGGSHAFRIMMDGPGGPWRITSRKLIQRDAPIEDVGALGGLLSKLVGNPVTYTYRAVLESKLVPGQVSGLLEVTQMED